MILVSKRTNYNCLNNLSLPVIMFLHSDVWPRSSFVGNWFAYYDLLDSKICIIINEPTFDILLFFGSLFSHCSSQLDSPGTLLDPVCSK